MNAFEYFQPTGLAAASELLRDCGSEARILAGGTDLTVALREGRLRPRVIVDLKRIADLSSAIEVHAERVVIGARATMSEVAAHEDILRLCPALAEAAGAVGSVQVRNRATLCGNVCNASPAADTVPVLAACGAVVEIKGPSGCRTMPVVDVIQGNRRIALDPGELVAAIHLPAGPGLHAAAFGRITRRRGVDLAVVNVCCSIDGSGIATFAFGAVAPRPFVVRDGGELAARDIGSSEMEALMDVLFSGATPISDVRASAAYRRAMVKVLAGRVLARAVRRLATGGGHA